MSKIIATILLKNRTQRELTVNREDSFFIFNEGLYVLAPKFIQVDEEDIPRLYYFEDVPTPINVDEENQGDRYLDERLVDNLLINLNPYLRGSLFGDLFKFFDSPGKVVIAILGLIIMFALISSGGKI